MSEVYCYIYILYGGNIEQNYVKFGFTIHIEEEYEKYKKQYKVRRVICLSQ